MSTVPHEITEPVDLCLPNGSLNPAAVGWSRTPLHSANLTGWGRNKRWEYWGVVTPTHSVGIVVSSLDYAGVHSLYLLDRSTGQETTRGTVVPLARGARMPPTSGAGTAYGRGRGLEITIDQQPGRTTILAEADGVTIDLAVGPGGESLGVVVPWSRRRFQYTVKDLGRPVEGTITLGTDTYAVSPTDSFAVLDHGRGRWPYSMTWNWAAGSRPGGDLGIQLGGRWTEGTGQTENGLFIDGRLHKIHEGLTWTYDREDWTAPWMVEGERLRVELTPFHERVDRTNLLVVAGETHQCFGTFSGWAVDDHGRRVDLSGLVGWAEEARNRW